MTTLQLHVDRVLQGSFDLKVLNLLFVFQVNCPICLMYGFPLVNKLYWRYRESELNILGLATAVEDFDYNTATNTELLLTQKKMIGETRQVIGEDYLQAINFPVAIDQLTTGEELATPENIEAVCQTILGFDGLSQPEQEALRQKVKAHLQKTSTTSATFTLNHLSKTPAFLLVDQTLQVFDGWFGYLPEAEVIQRIETCWFND